MKQIIFIEKTKLSELKEKLKEANIDVKEGSYQIGGCIDLEKQIMYPLNVTCMCGFSNGKNRPLFDEEIISYFKELIINKDMNKLDCLYKQAKKDTSRPIGGFFGII